MYSIILIIFAFLIIILILVNNVFNYKNSDEENEKVDLSEYNIFHDNTNFVIPNTEDEKDNLNEKLAPSFPSSFYGQYYKPKIYLITLNELKFYTILLEIAKELDLILFSQVSLYNIVSMNEKLNYSTRMKYFNKIAAKSIDFVLVDKKTCRIKLCIELDDNTHKKIKRVERDKFINQLFKDLNINLLRYPVYNVYYKDTLKNRIQNSIKDHYYSKY